MVRFQLMRMSSYAKKKVQMCSVTQHHCRRRQMWGCFPKFTQSTHFLSDTKNDLSWLNNLFTVRLQLIRMSSYAKNKLQMCSVSQHQCRRRQMCGNFHKFTQYTHFFCYKNDLSWLNNLFTVRFQLIRMSSYAKNKLQMCSVTHCRRQMSKFTQSLFVTEKVSVLGEFVKISTHLATSTLMLRTNYTSVVCSLHKRTSLMSWSLTVNRLFSQDKSFFVSDKKWVLWVNLGKHPHIWRRLQWCWVTEHICTFFLA